MQRLELDRACLRRVRIERTERRFVFANWSGIATRTWSAPRAVVLIRRGSPLGEEDTRGRALCSWKVQHAMEHSRGPTDFVRGAEDQVKSSDSIF